MKFSRLFYSIFFVLLFAGVLSAQEGKPILTDIKFLINGLAVETTSYEDIRVQLIFNEPMDQTQSPTVKFGLSSPFGFNVPSEGQGWITNTLWQGLFTVSDANPNDDDGEYNFQIYGAKDSEGAVMDTTLSSNLDETLYICRSGKVELSTITMDFDTIRIGTNKILSFVLGNESCADLIVNSISVTPPFYLYESPFEFGLSANSARQMSVWFVPSARTTYNGTLTINSNDRQQNQHVMQLTGTATGPKIILTPGTPINFGKVEIGEDSTLSFNITNAWADNPTLTDTLTVSNILASHSVYQASPTSFEIAPGDTQQVDVTFTPLQKISYNNQTLQINSDDLTKQVVYLTLHGNSNDDSPPPPPANITATWSGLNGYINGWYLPICWDNPDDPTGIREIWWKFSLTPEPPISPNDTTSAGGRYIIEENATCAYLELYGRITSGFWYCYIWLVDGQGNSGFLNYAEATFNYDSAPPSPPPVLSRSIPSGQWFTNEQDFNLTIEIPKDVNTHYRDAIEVRWKYQTQPISGNDYNGRYEIDEIFENQVSFRIPFNSTSLCGDDELFIWLVDSAGNASPDSITAVPYKFDICSGFVTSFTTTWSGYNGYINGAYLPVCWTLEGGESYIAQVYWKFSRTPALPESAVDTTQFGGRIVLAEGATCANLKLFGKITSGRWYCYAWAVFNTGNNSSYLDPITVTFNYDTNPPGKPVITDWLIPTYRWFGSSNLYRLAIRIPVDPARNTRDASEVRWKFKTPPASASDYASRLVFSGANPEIRPFDVTFNSEELCGDDSLYIWLADSAGNASSDSVAFTRYRFDICPPNITRFHRDTLNVGELGLAYTDTVIITDNVGVDTAWAHYRFGGAEAEEPVRPLTRIAGTDRWVIDIPQAGVTRRGLEFSVIALDSLENSGMGPVETDLCETEGLWFPVRTRVTGAGDFRVDEDGRPVPLITREDSTNYQLFSIPYALDTSAVLNVLEDDLGKYDITKWRLFDYKTDTTASFRYLEGASARPFAPGRSFFIITREEDKVIDSGPGTTIRTVCNDTIRLYEGWNLIATPFNFPVHKESLSLINSNSVVSLRSYEHGWNIVDVMDPWKGYALFVTRGDDDNDNSSRSIYLVVRPKAAPGRLSKKTDDLAVLAPEEWQMQISATAGNVHDRENWLGVRSLASAGYDAYELAEPPVIGKYVKVAFGHQEWGLPVNDFSTDLRPAGNAEQTWEFAVTTNKSNTQVRLNFQFLGNLPETAEVYLVDESLRLSQNLKTQPVYTFMSGAKETEKSFKVIVGSLDYAIAQAGDIGLVPDKFELFQNYPNPFNPDTQIRYNLPEAGAVKLEIFDLLGRQVATLVNNNQHKAGFHIITWNGKTSAGKPVASGVYLYRLTTGRQTVVRKMLMMK